MITHQLTVCVCHIKMFISRLIFEKLDVLYLYLSTKLCSPNCLFINCKVFTKVANIKDFFSTSLIPFVLRVVIFYCFFFF